MINNSTNSKLDEVVKTTLTDYDATFEASDWNRMESMLDAAPKASSFKWSYVVIAVVAMGLAGGGYALFTKTGSSASNTSTVTPAAEHATPTVSTPAKVVPSPAPAITNTAVAGTEVKTNEPPVTETVIPKNETVVADKKEEKKEEKLVAKGDPKKEDPKKKKKDKNTTKEEDVNPANVRIMGMGNEPIFGDMLDSSKGIVGETREKEETKKAAKAKKDVPVGWNSIMSPNVNPDSLRKYREKRDSTKVD